MSLLALWLPILVSAVAVFVASSIIHMAIKWHMPEYKGFANEDAVRAAVRASNPVPGQYAIPYCADHKLMRTPEFQKKFADGPVGFLTLRPNGFPSMGPTLGAWFVMNLVVSALAACAAAAALGPGASTPAVCTITGLATLLAYGGGPTQLFIWMGKPARAFATELLDAIIYAALVAAVFAMMWPG